MSEWVVRRQRRCLFVRSCLRLLQVRPGRSWTISSPLTLPSLQLQSPRKQTNTTRSNKSQNSSTLFCDSRSVGLLTQSFGFASWLVCGSAILLASRIRYSKHQILVAADTKKHRRRVNLKEQRQTTKKFPCLKIFSSSWPSHILSHRARYNTDYFFSHGTYSRGSRVTAQQ